MLVSEERTPIGSNVLLLSFSSQCELPHFLLRLVRTYRKDRERESANYYNGVGERRTFVSFCFPSRRSSRENCLSWSVSFMTEF